MRRWWATPFKSPTFRLVAIITLAVAATILFRPDFTEFLELKLYDLKFRVRGPLRPAPEVVLLAVDDASVKKVGRWPWSREIMAQLLERLKAAGPKVIGLDIIFAERQEDLGLKTVQRLCVEVARRSKDDQGMLALLKEEEQRVDVDRKLAAVIRQGPPTVLGFYFLGARGSATGLKAEQLMAAAYTRMSTYNMVRMLDPEMGRMTLMEATDVELNLPEITSGAAGGGYFNMVPDRDGAVRWLPLGMRYGGDIFAPLSLVTLAHYQGKPPLIMTLSRLGVEEVRLGRLVIPVDRFGRLLINYLGPPGIFPTYSAQALLEGKIPAGALKDKIVLVGATAIGIYDLRVTPFSGVYPGLEIHATIVDNLLKGRFLQAPRLTIPPSLLLVLGLGILLGLVLPRLSAAWSFVFAMVLVEVYVLANYFLFKNGIQLELFYPLAEVALVFMGINAQRFLAEEKERERIKMTFQSYVAPEVVNEILKHPDRLHLGGERRELTIMFSDIRGFTTLSETLAPEVLTGVLQDFLTPMSDIIIQHGGTIDKYIGDAIMALFNAPLDRPEHARDACRAALGMVADLKALGKEWAAQGRPVIRVGVGINTGYAAVGNMGSARLFDYTAIGDNVNLASRLEGLNKYYGTEIIISAATAQELNGEFILREVDRVKVKGKAQPLLIYELLGEGTPEEELAAFLKTYDQGRALYQDRRFADAAGAFAEALKLRPGDVTSTHYLELAQKYVAEPPGEDWEAVRVMDQK